MHYKTLSRDPRSIVTPDAFEVSTALLGTPLADPGRRLLAILIDLAVIGIITVLTNSFALILGVVAALLFVRAGFKRTPVRGTAFGRAMRVSVGCLGLTIGLVTALLWAALGADFGRSSRASLSDPDGLMINGRPRGVLSVLGGAAAGIGLSNAETLQEAEAAARVLALTGQELGLSPEEIRVVLTDLFPADVSWSDQIDTLVDRIVSGGPEPALPPASGAIADVASLSTADAFHEYESLLRADSAADSATARRQALETRLTQEIADDTLAALGGRILELEDRAERLNRELTRAEDALLAATSGGIFGWLRKFVDELGFGFGWASLYLTVILSWWNGQTIGKRVMGIRVLRLDGEPITWWVAFERAGGYAAGFATGLLGFAQVYWDANRQAIHDRIVGTVVVRDGAEKVLDWESTL